MSLILQKDRDINIPVFGEKGLKKIKQIIACYFYLVTAIVITVYYMNCDIGSKSFKNLATIHLC